MGYTYYYRGWITLSEAFIADVQKILENTDISIKGWDGKGDPVISPDEIRLNGDFDNEGKAETFVLVNGVNHRNFTKTYRLPYGEVVGAILLRASYYSNKFKCRSDGSWDEGEWKRAQALYSRTFGENATKPEEVHESTVVA
jgi:hypothetical protein